MHIPFPGELNFCNVAQAVVDQILEQLFPHMVLDALPRRRKEESCQSPKPQEATLKTKYFLGSTSQSFGGLFLPESGGFLLTRQGSDGQGPHRVIFTRVQQPGLG